MAVEARERGDSASLSFLAGGGDMGELIRRHDWSATPLGAPHDWPQSLKTAVRIMLTSRQPIWIGWGADLTYLYNDAYKSIIGGKHPWALGQPTRDVWREIWTDIGPLLATAMGGVEGTYVEEQLLIMERNGYPEETYYTFSYSPIPDDDGSPGGIICANTEDTGRVIGERQISLLRELAANTVDARSWRDAAERSVAALAGDTRDLPFALLYAAEQHGEPMALAVAAGLRPGQAAAPETLEVSDQAVWPIGAAVRDSEPRVVGDLSSRFSDDLPTGAWDQPPSAAVILPLPAMGETRGPTVLIAGLNPFRVFDEDYAGFLGLAAGQIASAIASADAYQEERRRAEALAELDRAKTVFFSNVSHEFRTPLTLMLGPLEDALDRPDMPPATRSELEVARRNGGRLLRLVNSLLDFSRIEAGRVQANFEPTDLGQFSAEIASSFRSAMEKAGLELKLDCESLAQPVFIDRDMWEKVLLNLLSNAFKFTFKGEVAVSVRPDPSGVSAHVTIRDTGIGIPEAELPKLFERFHRVEGAKGRSFEGSGIGLALVSELVKLHGGEIAVESAPGVGTAFTVTLPMGSRHLPAEHIRQAAPSPTSLGRAQEFVDEALRWLPDQPAGPDAGRPTLAGAVASGHGLGKRVILADDNADMRGYVCRLLDDQGYEVIQAADGQAALSLARATRPDLILTDVMMPVLDGFGLLRAIREDAATADLPVVMLSARAGEEAKVEGLDAGADDYMVKPFGARELLARVNANIQMAEVRRDAARAVRESQAYLRDLLDSTGEGFYAIDERGVTTTVNRAFLEMLGFARAEDAVGRELHEVIHHSHADGREYRVEDSPIRRAATQGIPAEVEGELFFRLDGSAIPVEYRAHPIWRDGALVGAICTFTDISARLAAQAELANKQAALEALNASLEDRVATEITERLKAEDALRQVQKMEAIGQLTGGVAHDFNNLLTVIIGGLDTIKRSRPDDVARVQRSADMALKGAQRAASLTSRLLAFSRRQPLAPKILELNHLVRDMTDLLHRTLGEQIELEGVLAPRLWRIEADQNQLESAIINLAVNARDAMPAGGKLTIETSNTLLDESYAAIDAEVAPGQYVAIAVSDCGTGMDKETLSRVFEPFFTTKEVGRGTGLGLSMVYGFVKQSGGHVAIYSEPGEGTTVRLYFPRHAGLAELADDIDGIDAPQGSEGEVILLVEDNEDVRGYSAMILKELGYAVLEAEEGDAALAILRSGQRVDLLFTDVVLPGRSGRDLADAACLLRPSLKVLFTTGYSRNAIVHHGRLDAGVQLITKPFTFEQLAVRVRNVIDLG
jgi:PAS domain S-box-containing protein